ncbi:neutral zinc metallopeptidase [Nonomuraea sp. MCN248]|uniref:Neutral zinc metallopeptidase n=1 Tax=Nonomuraea corallina TaxID=2989783 RepID=A0ABT4SNQ1_9ACTN|nr:neutral zinc metallopeptidase [Nonomuraea corallina]MDA0638873.1 neutral zinc metallopeptidase [Nonomuraea corallina]
MRLAPLTAAAAACALLLSGTACLSGTAHAAPYPIRDRDLTANKLYRAGELQTSSCPEEEVQPGDVEAAKRYLTTALDCLNTAWGAYFKRARLPFRKARIGFVTKPRRFCQASWGEAAAVYCPQERRFLVLLDDNLLDDPSDLYLFNLAAHEYGHHVQLLTGIERAYQRHPYRNKKELYEQLRRVELQAECLGGVFVGSVWTSLDRTSRDWDELMRITRASGDEQFKVRSHGKGRTIAAWLDRGRRAKDPRACNTWTAPSAKVS